MLLPERGALATVALQDALLGDMTRRMPDEPAFSVDLGGTAWIAPRAWRVLQSRMIWGLSLAVLAIALLFWGLFRSVRMALLTILPNVLPLACVLCAMAVLGIPAKGNNAVVFSIAYGLAVDDTIHLLSRLRAALRDGLPIHDAILRAHRQVRGAITLTTLVLAGGFAVLLMSTFEFNVTLGLQMVVAALAALMLDLFALPALLKVSLDGPP